MTSPPTYPPILSQEPPTRPSRPRLVGVAYPLLIPAPGRMHAVRPPEDETTTPAKHPYPAFVPAAPRAVQPPPLPVRKAVEPPPLPELVPTTFERPPLLGDAETPTEPYCPSGARMLISRLIDEALDYAERRQFARLVSAVNY